MQALYALPTRRGLTDPWTLFRDATFILHPIPRLLLSPSATTPQPPYLRILSNPIHPFHPSSSSFYSLSSFCSSITTPADVNTNNDNDSHHNVVASSQKTAQFCLRHTKTSFTAQLASSAQQSPGSLGRATARRSCFVLAGKPEPWHSSTSTTKIIIAHEFPIITSPRSARCRLTIQPSSKRCRDDRWGSNSPCQCADDDGW